LFYKDVKKYSFVSYDLDSERRGISESINWILLLLGSEEVKMQRITR